MAAAANAATGIADSAPGGEEPAVSILIAVSGDIVVEMDEGQCRFRSPSGVSDVLLKGREPEVAAKTVSALMLTPILDDPRWETIRRQGLRQSGTVGVLVSGFALLAEPAQWGTQLHRTAHGRLEDSWKLNGVFWECDFGQAASVWGAWLRTATGVQHQLLVTFLREWMLWTEHPRSQESGHVDTASRECERRDCADFLNALSAASTTWRRPDSPVFTFL